MKKQTDDRPAVCNFASAHDLQHISRPSALRSVLVDLSRYVLLVFGVYIGAAAVAAGYRTASCHPYAEVPLRAVRIAVLNEAFKGGNLRRIKLAVDDYELNVIGQRTCNSDADYLRRAETIIKHNTHNGKPALLTALLHNTRVPFPLPELTVWREASHVPTDETGPEPVTASFSPVDGQATVAGMEFPSTHDWFKEVANCAGYYLPAPEYARAMTAARRLAYDKIAEARHYYDLKTRFEMFDAHAKRCIAFSTGTPHVTDSDPPHQRELARKWWAYRRQLDVILGGNSIVRNGDKYVNESRLIDLEIFSSKYKRVLMYYSGYLTDSECDARNMFGDPFFQGDLRCFGDLKPAVVLYGWEVRDRDWNAYLRTTWEYMTRPLRRKDVFDRRNRKHYLDNIADLRQFIELNGLKPTPWFLAFVRDYVTRGSLIRFAAICLCAAVLLMGMKTLRRARGPSSLNHS